MNWLKQTKSILGKFWSLIFGEPDFTLGVENLETVLDRVQQARHDSWVSGNFPLDTREFQKRVPYPIFLLKSKTRMNPQTQQLEIEDCVVRPPASWDDVIGDNVSFDARQTEGWLIQSRFDIPVPHHISDHVVAYTRTLFNRLDYEWVDNCFLFHMDIRELNLPEITVTDAEGNLLVYWKVFGWADVEEAVKDPVAACDDSVLNPVAAIAWDIHQNGVTYHNARKLLAGVVGSVVCDVDGAVDFYWTEQDMQCLLIGEHVYTAPLSTQRNVSVGDNVHKGSILFGSLRMLPSAELLDEAYSPDTDFPGIKVRTDVGELIALNEDNMNAVSIGDGVYTLPLVRGYGDVAADAAYVELCQRRLADATCPIVRVPAVVNPFKFIMMQLRKGVGILVSLTTGADPAIPAALNCIRKGINASGMMTVYMQAEGDTLTANASFTADAGNAAVAEDATLTLQQLYAEAEIIL